MGRYFFHVHDGKDIVDKEGMELADLAAAQKVAVRYASSLLIETDTTFWQGIDWEMRVTDERDLTLFTLNFMGNVAAVIR